MTEYYFTRHGESQANVDEVFAGILDSPLTQKGREAAKVEGDRLAQTGVSYDLILCSPLSRAKETAEIIALAVGYPVADVIVEELLCERSFGKLAGQSWSSVPDEAADMIVQQGGESIADLTHRVRRALGVVQELSLGKQSVLIVGHGTWYQMAEALLDGREGNTFLESANLPNNTVVEIRLEGFTNENAA